MFFLSIAKRSQLGLVVRPLQGWLNERVTGLVENAIYRRKLGTQIQKCGFAECAESASKRLQSRSESCLTHYLWIWAAAKGVGHLECLKAPAPYL